MGKLMGIKEYNPGGFHLPYRLLNAHLHRENRCAQELEAGSVAPFQSTWYQKYTQPPLANKPARGDCGGKAVAWVPHGLALQSPWQPPHTLWSKDMVMKTAAV